jgi:hypothetical protein
VEAPVFSTGTAFYFTFISKYLLFLLKNAKKQQSPARNRSRTNHSDKASRTSQAATMPLTKIAAIALQLWKS